jgi:hypothetical protein
MGRTTTPELDARLAAQVTAVGYLVRLETEAVRKQGRAPTTLQLCDIGEINNATLGTFAAEDIAVQNAGDPAAALTIQNVNGAAGSFILNANPLSSVRVTIWQVERLAPDDAVMLGVYLVEEADAGLDVVKVKLHGEGVKFAYAPSRRVIPKNGFRYAIRPGEVFLWGAQRVIIKERGR